MTALAWLPSGLHRSQGAAIPCCMACVLPLRLHLLRCRPHALQGHGRSAAAAAALLLAAGKAPSADAALGKVKELRPGASPNHRQVAALHSWAAKYRR